MEVINKVVPNSEQMEGFAKPGPEGPFYMVNLLKSSKRRRSMRMAGRRSLVVKRLTRSMRRGLVNYLRMLEARLSSMPKSSSLCLERSKNSGTQWL